MHLGINPDLISEINNDFSVVETLLAIEHNPTFSSVPSISSVPPMTGQLSSDEDVPLK